jgi:hypothetical protein
MTDEELLEVVLNDRDELEPHYAELASRFAEKCKEVDALNGTIALASGGLKEKEANLASLRSELEKVREELHNYKGLVKSLEVFKEADAIDLKMCHEELDKVRGEVKEWLCESCNTVYPGPPQEGFKCVECPKCGGDCGPHETIKRRKAEAETIKWKKICGLIARSEREKMKRIYELEGQVDTTKKDKTPEEHAEWRSEHLREIDKTKLGPLTEDDINFLILANYEQEKELEKVRGENKAYEQSFDRLKLELTQAKAEIERRQKVIDDMWDWFGNFCKSINDAHEQPERLKEGKQ